jgi:hypothetical protein
LVEEAVGGLSIDVARNMNGNRVVEEMVAFG